MGLDLDQVAIFASWLTIVGDTIAVLYEMNQPPEEKDQEDEDKNSNKKNGKKKNSCDEEDEDEEDKGEETDYGLFGGYLSFLGDLISAIVAQVQAREEYDGCIPKYVQKGLLGGWLVVIGDILQLQTAIEESAREQEQNILPFLQ